MRRNEIVLPLTHLPPCPTQYTHHAGNSSKYSGMLDCFVQTARTDGALAFYKGFIPNFARLGSWNVTMFLVYEQTKRLFTPKDA